MTGGIFDYADDSLVPVDAHNQRQQHIASLEQSDDPDDHAEAAIHRVISNPHDAESIQRLRDLMGNPVALRQYADHFGTGALDFTNFIHQAAAHGMPAGQDAMHTMSRRNAASMASQFAQNSQAEAEKFLGPFEDYQLGGKFVPMSRETYDAINAANDAESARYSQLAALRHQEAAEEHRRVGEEQQAQVHEQAAEAHLKAFALRHALAGGYPAPKAIAPPAQRSIGVPTVKGFRKSLPPANSSRY